jgi:hypothetical protein
MKDHIEGPAAFVRFDLVDIREMDGERLLASVNAGDNVLALLTRVGEQREAVRQILERIAARRPGERDEALAELFYYLGITENGRRSEAGGYEDAGSE